jgi:hypothetical protein
VAVLKIRKLLVMSLLLLYVALLFYFAQNGRPGPWHEECINYWNHQKWQDLTSLAKNLTSIGKADPETLYFGTLAARQLGHSEEEKALGNLLARQRFLNPPMELEISSLAQENTSLETLRLFRSRVTLGVVALLIVLNFIMFRRRSPSIWQIILPVIGAALLFL